MSGLLAAVGLALALFAAGFWAIALIWSTGASTNEHASIAFGALVVFVVLTVLANLLAGIGLALARKPGR